MRGEDFGAYSPLPIRREITFRSKCAACNMLGLKVPLGSLPKIIRCDLCGSASIAVFGIVIYIESALTSADSKEDVEQVLARIFAAVTGEVQEVFRAFCRSPECAKMVDNIHGKKTDRKIPAEDSCNILKLGIGDMSFAEQSINPVLLKAVGGLWDQRG